MSAAQQDTRYDKLDAVITAINTEIKEKEAELRGLYDKSGDKTTDRIVYLEKSLERLDKSLERLDKSLERLSAEKVALINQQTALTNQPAQGKLPYCYKCRYVTTPTDSQTHCRLVVKVCVEC